MSLSAAIVYMIQARLPAECQVTHQCPVAMVDYTKIGNAAEIRDAVSAEVSDIETAIDAIEFAAFESNNNLNAIGDGGKSKGAWQTSRGGLTARDQLAAWLAMRSDSLKTCGDLTHLASGSCNHGRKLVYRRWLIKQAILESLRTQGDNQ